MLLEVNDYQFLEMIEDRIRYWKNDEIIIRLYRDMYERRFESEWYPEDKPFNLNSIVDNDIINYTDTVYKEDNLSDYQLLLEAYKDKELDVEQIDFNNIQASYIEAYDSYNEIFLVSYYG